MGFLRQQLFLLEISFIGKERLEGWVFNGGMLNSPTDRRTGGVMNIICLAHRYVNSQTDYIDL